MSLNHVYLCLTFKEANVLEKLLLTLRKGYGKHAINHLTQGAPGGVSAINRIIEKLEEI